MEIKKLMLIYKRINNVETIKKISPATTDEIEEIKKVSYLEL